MVTLEAPDLLWIILSCIFAQMPLSHGDAELLATLEPLLMSLAENCTGGL